MKRKAGFTLLELIVTIGIISTIMAIALPAYRNAESRQILRNAAQMIAMDLKAQKQRANLLNVPSGIIFTNGAYNKFEYDTPPDQPGAQQIIREVNLERLFGRQITISSSSLVCYDTTSQNTTAFPNCSGNCISYAPQLGAVNTCLPKGTITLTLGGDNKSVLFATENEQPTGEIIVQ